MDCRFFFISSFTIYALIIAPWGLSLSYILKYLILLVFIIAATRSMVMNFGLVSCRTPVFFQMFTLLLPLALALFFSVQLFYALKGYMKPDKALNLEFPLKQGMFCIIQGGNSRLINHHNSVKTQKYGLDVVLINKFGSRTNKIFPEKLNEFNIYSIPVYSPCSGVVIRVVDFHSDEQLGTRNTQNPGGNYVAVCDENRVIILAHLQKNSISVKEGDIIHVGDFIGKVGNSGNTTEPHLHIHGLLLPAENFFFDGKPIPLTFDGKFLHRNQLIWNN